MLALLCHDPRAGRQLEDRQRDGVLPDDGQLRRVSVADLLDSHAQRRRAKAQLPRGRGVTLEDQDAGRRPQR